MMIDRKFEYLEILYALELNYKWFKCGFYAQEHQEFHFSFSFLIGDIFRAEVSCIGMEGHISIRESPQDKFREIYLIFGKFR